MINILISSFNDNDINNTINSLIKNSLDDTKLKFKILFVEIFNLDDKYFYDPRFEFVTIHKNKGVGYSRKILTSNLPKNEYFLQIDSHHRFIKNWDKILIDNYKSLKSINEKVIISTSLPPFDENGNFSNCFNTPKLDSYTKNGIPRFISTCGTSNKETGLISAHFLFGETKFFNEVKYKDNWYFFGEEILLSLSAFNSGYKVFTPQMILGWHRYKTNINDVQRDFKSENKTHNRIKKEIKSLYSEKFSELIGVDFLNFKCSQRNYFVHGTKGYDTIYILTPNNEKIMIKNVNDDEIVRFSSIGFFKGAVLTNTKTQQKRYFSLC
jgi:hypothetical protein